MHVADMLYLLWLMSCEEIHFCGLKRKFRIFAVDSVEPFAVCTKNTTCVSKIEAGRQRERVTLIVEPLGTGLRIDERSRLALGAGKTEAVPCIIERMTSYGN